MAYGAGGRPKGRTDNPYKKRKQRREPTDAERKQAAEKAAKTRAATRAKKDADKKAKQDAQNAKLEAKRRDFFKPQRKACPTINQNEQHREIVPSPSETNSERDGARSAGLKSTGDDDRILVYWVVLTML